MDDLGLAGCFWNYFKKQRINYMHDMEVERKHWLGKLFISNVLTWQVIEQPSTCLTEEKHHFSSGAVRIRHVA